MKKVLCMLLMISLMINFGYAKEQYTNLKDPKNIEGKENTLTQSRGDYTYLTASTQDYNGMGYESFSYECRGEDYLEVEGGAGGYAITGKLGFIKLNGGKYTNIQHKGLDIKNYSQTIGVNLAYSCSDDDCDGYVTSINKTFYKAYTEKEFYELKSSLNANYCEHVQSVLDSTLGKFQLKQIRSSASSKVNYYVYEGMPVGIPAIALVTSISPSGDLWVAVFKPDAKLGLYNAGVFQIFDSKCNPHIKHTATKITEAEKKLTDTEYFSDVSKKSLAGMAFYEDTKVTGAETVYRFFIVCNECSTCERCITSEYSSINSYVTYGEIPEFYLSRGCPVHACCFVHDYPVAYPDEYEGIKCPDLKLEGDKYIACEDHTCKRWLEHSDYRENFAPQTCLKVVAGRSITDAASGSKLVRYTGQVDEGIIYDKNGKAVVIDGGYSDYCSNHMCNSFFCNSSREDSESHAAKYDKAKNMVTMANQYCSTHKSGCGVIYNYKEQPTEKMEANGGDTIIEQIEKDKRDKKFNLCNKTVTQTFYAYVQPNAMICEDCYKLMAKGKLNYENSTKNLNVGTCSNCGDFGVSKFGCYAGAWCATCIDFDEFSIVRRNVKDYNYSDIRGIQKENRCEYKIQRFAGDDTSLCGERCVEGRRYCYWHLCDTEECVEPVKYNGIYFCNKCVPDIDDSVYKVDKPVISKNVDRNPTTMPPVDKTDPIENFIGRQTDIEDIRKLFYKVAMEYPSYTKVKI